MNNNGWNQGDEIVCINNSSYPNILTIGRSYKIIGIHCNTNINKYQVIIQSNSNSYTLTVFCDLFLSLNDFNKKQRLDKLKKLNKLCNINIQ